MAEISDFDCFWATKIILKFRFFKENFSILGNFGVKFQNLNFLPGIYFLELKKQLKPKCQPFSFSFAENEFLFFAILKKKI
jgi:hypothetical protein